MSYMPDIPCVSCTRHALLYLLAGGGGGGYYGLPEIDFRETENIFDDSDLF